jgi:DNA-binding response OmpR family regulator
MKLLIVEDDRKIADSLKKGLVNEGYTVEVSYDGEEGLELAEISKPDLIILDRLLPKVGGIKFIERLRNQNIPTPILMLSALGQTEEKIEGLNIGADDYLSKPFSFDELLARIKSLLRRPKEFTNKELVIKNLTLDLQNYLVKIDTNIVSLSKKEFQILEFLVRNKNKIVSKERIIENVWEYDSDVLPNNVEVFIASIRNKVEKPYNITLIQTFRGLGYKIED